MDLPIRSLTDVILLGREHVERQVEHRAPDDLDRETFRVQSRRLQLADPVYPYGSGRELAQHRPRVRNRGGHCQPVPFIKAGGCGIDLWPLGSRCCRRRHCQ